MTMSRLLQQCRRLPYAQHHPLKKYIQSTTQQPAPLLSRFTILSSTARFQNIQLPLPSPCFRSFCTTPNTQPPKSITSSRVPPPTSQILTREALQRSFRRWGRWFTIRMLLFVGVIVGTAIYCWDHPNEVINLKTRISKIFSDVGSQTLNQKELQIQATAYSKQMIKDVFSDASMQQETKQFFISILSEQDFLDTISVGLQELFQRDIMIESVKELVINVFNDPAVIEQCKVLVGHAISAPENKQLLLQTLHDILDDEELVQHARDLANHTVKGVLDDEDIKALSAVFLQHVLDDDSVQQSSSDSLYKILVGALTPTAFKRKKKRNTNETENHQVTEMVEHVPHQHIDVESIEMDLEKAKTIKNEQEEGVVALLDDDDDAQSSPHIGEEQEEEIIDHANQISSVIGNIQQ